MSGGSARREVRVVLADGSVFLFNELRAAMEPGWVKCCRPPPDSLVEPFVGVLWWVWRRSTWLVYDRRPRGASAAPLRTSQ
ncbi:MAG: hypothetical protein Kow00122_16480 [Thermoleophilia bacterium]